MQTLFLSLLFFVILFLGGMAGFFVNKRIPKNLLNEESRSSINLAIGLVAMIAALTLGTAITSTKNSFDSSDNALKKLSIEILTLDRSLLRYGPEGDAIRSELRTQLKQLLDLNAQINKKHQQIIAPNLLPTLDELFVKIHALKPKNDYQRNIYLQIKLQMDDLMKSRWFTVINVGETIPIPYLIVLQLWLFVVFFGYGVLYKPNPLVAGIFFLSTLSVSASIFLLLELDGAFDGYISVSFEPLNFVYGLLVSK